MDDEFVRWEDLHLDDILGENNWTDDDEATVLGPESEWGSSTTSSGGEDEILPDAAEKENVPAHLTSQSDKPKTPMAKKNSSSASVKHYQCPLCDKQYISTSGFRGHVMKKHNRPDIKAHHHQTGVQPAQNLPRKRVPLTSTADIEKQVPGLCTASLHEIKDDKFHSLPSSKSGHYMIAISQHLVNINLTVFHLLLITHLCAIFSSGPEQSDITRLLSNVYHLRTNESFLNSVCDFVMGVVDFEVPRRIVKLFVQRFLTCFVTAYFKLQKDLLTAQEKHDIEEISANDRHVLCHICGYIIHALNKRYLKAKKKWSKLCILVANLKMREDNTETLPSEWTDALDRGGLKKPSAKFFSIVVQIERWLREVSQMNRLHSDSLVDLKATLTDYQLLRLSWTKLMADDDNKWLILEHVLSLYLKVRGFAITRLVRKQMQKKRKNAKVAAGSQKALRKSLKLMNK